MCMYVNPRVQPRSVNSLPANQITLCTTSCLVNAPTYIRKETSHTLREQFGKNHQGIQKNTGDFPDAEHFTSPGHTLAHITVRDLRKCSGAVFRQKQLQMEVIHIHAHCSQASVTACMLKSFFGLSTMQPVGLNNVVHFIQTACI